MNKILSTQCDDSKISIAMDDLSYPHCVWIEDDKVKYSRFYAGEWRSAGSQSMVLSSENELKISKHCISFDDSGNPFFALLDGDSLILISWNGISWVQDVALEVTTDEIPLTWSVLWAGFYVLVVIADDSESKTIYALDKSSGSWSIPDGILIPDQDNISIELKISKVASDIYSFWNGKDESNGTSWIGHAIWNLNAQEWTYTENKQIELSIANGDIAGMDFVVTEELLSSSSSSSLSSVSSPSSISSPSSVSSPSSISSPSSVSSPSSISSPSSVSSPSSISSPSSDSSISSPSSLT